MAGGSAAGRDSGSTRDGESSWPAMYRTCHPVRDTLYAPGTSFPNGVRYPGTDTSISDWYIGAANAKSWSKFTVSVPKASRYWISSIFAADTSAIRFQISFQDSARTVSTPMITLNGSTGPHAWRKYKNIASINLDSGIQVLYFQNRSSRLLQDFLDISADSNEFVETTQRVRVPAAYNAHQIHIDRNSIRFSLADQGMTRVSVFDCLGREVVLITNRELAAGDHEITLGRACLNHGVYFIRVEHNSMNSVAKFEVIGK
jgi:hypothetical protein